MTAKIPQRGVTWWMRYNFPLHWSLRTPEIHPLLTSGRLGWHELYRTSTLEFTRCSKLSKFYYKLHILQHVKWQMLDNLSATLAPPDTLQPAQHFSHLSPPPPWRFTPRTWRWPPEASTFILSSVWIIPEDLCIFTLIFSSPVVKLRHSPTSPECIQNSYIPATQGTIHLGFGPRVFSFVFNFIVLSITRFGSHELC